MNSRWISGPARRGPGRAHWWRVFSLLCVAGLGCGGGGDGDGGSAAGKPAAPESAQTEAEQLGRELADIVDRVMAYKSSHRGNLPNSYRQAGIDSLTPEFVRRLARQGDVPVVTIAYRRTTGRELLSCEGTNLVLEDKLLKDGAFDVTCRLAAGGTRIFTVPPPPPPPKKED